MTDRPAYNARMIAINDLTPDALRFDGLSAAELVGLLDGTTDIIPRDVPETPVPADEEGSPVRAQGRVMWGPGIVAFDRVTPDETARIMDVFQRLQGRAPATS